MADHSDIEWTDATWQPITGCEIVSPGCINCYAMRLAAGRLRHHPSRKGLTVTTKAGPVWTGEVRFNEAWLTQPLKWKEPRRIFVCAHGDLFAEGVPDEWIDRVVAVMGLASHHTFQVLTKRADRMRVYFSSDETMGRVLSITNSCLRNDAGSITLSHRSDGFTGFVLPNVWLGVSAERQKEADERIPLLLQTPAAVRFISAEPLLGPIDLMMLKAGDKVYDAMQGCIGTDIGDGEYDGAARCAKLDWVIVGGDSGPNARPMHPDWARSLRDQCAAAGVPFFFKQNGEYIVLPTDRERDKEHIFLSKDWDYVRVGKKSAGRTLDSSLHSEMPRGRG